MQRAGLISDHLCAAAALVDGAVPPEREENACKLARKGNDRGSSSSALLDSMRPELQRNGFGSPTAQMQCPGSLYEYPAERAGARLRDRQALLSLGTRALAWNQAEIRLDLVGALETCDVV